MGKKAEFSVEPSAALCAISKVLGAKRQGETVAEKSRKLLHPGEYRLQGSLCYDMLVTVGEDAEAARYYGVPIDSILLLAFHFSGALREHYIKAAMVCKEITLAEMESRPVQAVTYEFPRVVEGKRGKCKTEMVEVVISAEEVAEQADIIAGKLVGLDEEETKAEQQKRKLFQEQIAWCGSKLKVMRKYEGPINVEEATFNVVEGELARERIAA